MNLIPPQTQSTLLRLLFAFKTNSPKSGKQESGKNTTQNPKTTIKVPILRTLKNVSISHEASDISEAEDIKNDQIIYKVKTRNFCDSLPGDDNQDHVKEVPTNNPEEFPPLSPQQPKNNLTLNTTSLSQFLNNKADSDEEEEEEEEEEEAIKTTQIHDQSGPQTNKITTKKKDQNTNKIPTTNNPTNNTTNQQNSKQAPEKMINIANLLKNFNIDDTIRAFKERYPNVKIVNHSLKLSNIRANCVNKLTLNSLVKAINHNLYNKVIGNYPYITLTYAPDDRPWLCVNRLSYVEAEEPKLRTHKKKLSKKLKFRQPIKISRLTLYTGKLLTTRRLL